MMVLIARKLHFEGAGYGRDIGLFFDQASRCDAFDL